MAQAVLIVGARGLGRELALRFGKAGWSVAVASRSQGPIDALLTDLAGVQPAGAARLGHAFDLGDPPSVERMCAAVWEAFGEVALVVAAQTSDAPFAIRGVLETPPEDLLLYLRGYPLASLALLRAVGPRLAARGRGTFVQVGTGGGLRLRDGMAGLSAAQHALRVLVQAAGRELRGRGVHCAYLAVEGQIDTPDSAAYVARHGRERTIPPEEIGRAIELLHGQDPRAWSFELSLRPAAAPAE